jgi:flavin reductase (DIM6/NTAB) family NADH-FMN oxidoreductase RutF
MQSTEDTFHALVGDMDYPMFIVTAAAEGERAGCLVGFATQSSIDPPRFLVLISRNNHTFGVAERAEVLVVHLVPADAQGIAELFGSETGYEVDKFDRCEWRPGPGGAPVLAACENWFAGRVLDRISGGDHVAFLLEPVAAEKSRSMESFSFHRARRIEAGREV